MKLKNKYIILEKLSDDMFGGNHPNGVNVGSIAVQGYALYEPTVGEQFCLFSSLEDVKIGEAIIPKEQLLTSWTSAVKEIDLENMILKTKNSTYKILIK